MIKLTFRQCFFSTDFGLSGSSFQMLIVLFEKNYAFDYNFCQSLSVNLSLLSALGGTSIKLFDQLTVPSPLCILNNC